MSRSYKRVAHFADYTKHRTRWAKRQASKHARKIADISNGSAYKKEYCSWNIRDFDSTSFTKLELEHLREYYPEYKIWNK